MLSLGAGLPLMLASCSTAGMPLDAGLGMLLLAIDAAVGMLW
jgi:hypothetical protein